MNLNMQFEVRLNWQTCSLFYSVGENELNYECNYEYICTYECNCSEENGQKLGIFSAE